jgi:hypothetical protein
MFRSANLPRAKGPEIWFRIVHAALHSQNSSNLATYREQEVEVALGPRGINEDGQVGVLTRRIEADLVVSVHPVGRGDLKPPTAPKTPRVVELLRKASEWKALLESGKVASQVEIAWREGITRARVTQV